MVGQGPVIRCAIHYLMYLALLLFGEKMIQGYVSPRGGLQDKGGGAECCPHLNLKRIPLELEVPLNKKTKWGKSEEEVGEKQGRECLGMEKICSTCSNPRQAARVPAVASRQE